MGSARLSGALRGAAGDVHCVPYLLLADTLAGIRAMPPAGMVRPERMPADPQEVVETWFAE